MGINFITSQIKNLERTKAPIEKQLAIAKTKMSNAITEFQTKIDLLESQLSAVNAMIEKYQAQQGEQENTSQGADLTGCSVNVPIQDFATTYGPQ